MTARKQKEKARKKAAADAERKVQKRKDQIGARCPDSTSLKWPKLAGHGQDRQPAIAGYYQSDRLTADYMIRLKNGVAKIFFLYFEAIIGIFMYYFSGWKEW